MGTCGNWEDASDPKAGVDNLEDTSSARDQELANVIFLFLAKSFQRVCFIIRRLPSLGEVYFAPPRGTFTFSCDGGLWVFYTPGGWACLTAGIVLFHMCILHNP